MKKLVNFFVFFLFFNSAMKAQINLPFYFDLATSTAINTANTQIKQQQEKTSKYQKVVQGAQAAVAAATTRVEQLQGYVYRGLTEVSGTVTNGTQILDIYRDIKGCKQVAGDIYKLVRTHPQYAVFGAKTSQAVINKAARIIAEASEIIQDGETNLMTAGDRIRLLENIRINVLTLYASLFDLKFKLERAKRLGFWKSINPFQGFVDRDKDIVENIMRRYKYSF